MVQEYAAFYSIEPWGPQRDNYHAATISHILANAHRSTPGEIPFGRFMWSDPVQDRINKDAAVLKSFRARTKGNAESS